MNGPFQVAQASGVGIGNNNNAAPRIFTLTKPLGDQAVVINLGYEQKVKVDFSGIANEKITLVRVGEKLIILFDNKSTVTVEPFFDSRHDALNNLSVEVAPGRDVSVSEFASLFPITTDQSVLPAAGEGNGNAQASGGNFNNSAVDPLSTGGPLDLLGQESLGNLASALQQFAGLPTDTSTPTTAPSAGFTLSNTLLIHDETVDVQIALGANDQGSALPSVFQQNGLVGWAQSSVSEIASTTADFGTNGAGSVTYALTTASGGAFNGVASGLQATITGNTIFLFTESNLIVGREGNGNVANASGAVAFQLYLDPDTLLLNVAQYEAIQHGGTSDPNDIASLANVVFIQQTVTDSLGLTATAVSSNSLGVAFLDDGPSISRDDGGERPSSAGFLELDETIGQGESPQTDRYNSGESESNGGPSNGILDDTGVSTITVSTAPVQGQAIGELSTAAGALAALFPGANIDFGTDGPGANGGVTNVLTLVLSDGTVGTTLTATALEGTALAGMSAAERAIVLVQVDADTIEGRIAGTAAAGDEFVAFRITLEGGSDPATAKITVDQFLAIDHGGSENPSIFDEQAFLRLVGAGTLNLQLTTTVTDGDGDQVSSPVQVNLVSNEISFIAFDDDGPTITRGEGGETLSLATLNLDETIGADRYNTALLPNPEGESNGGSSNGSLDDTGVSTITVSTTPVQGQAIGELSTSAGALANLFAAANVDFGTDGAGPQGGISNALTLVLSGESVATTLTATALEGTALEGLSAAERAIVLVQVDANTLEGRIVGTAAAGDEFVAFRITLEGGSDPASAKITVDQFLAIDHGGSENPSVLDEQTFLNLIGEGTLNLQLTTTVTDGDGDQASSSVQVNLIGNENSFIAFDDDGPTVTKGEGGETTTLALLNLDETIGADRYNTGEVPQDNNGEVDDKATTVTVSEAPTQAQAIGELSTAAGALAGLFTNASVDFGTDGPGGDGGISKELALVLSSDGIATTLTVTALDGTALETMTAGERAISLFQVDANTIEGRIAGTAADGDEYVAFTIKLNGTDPATATITVDQFLAIDHGGSEIPSVFDEQTFLNLVGEGTLNLQLTTTATDGDGDQASSSVQVNLIGNENSFIAFDDDGPTMVASGSIVANVDEDGLHAPGLSDSNLDNSRDGEVDGNESAVATSAVFGTLGTLINFGTDGFGSFGLKPVAAPVDSGLTSGGKAILIVTDANGLHGYVDNLTPGFDVGDREVFTLTVGSDGSYTFTLKDQIDHPKLDNEQVGDNTENTLVIDLASYVVATDGDGDSVSLGAGTFTVSVLDDIPVITARAPNETTVTTTETFSYTLQAGNADVRGMDGQNNHDIRLSGVDLNDNDDSVNTTGIKIGVGDAQSVDGFESQGQDSGPEILTMEFLSNFVVGVPNTNTYQVGSASFKIDVAEAQGIESAVVFVSATDGVSHNFVALNFTVDGSPFAATAVFQGGVQVGYVLHGVPDLSTVVAAGQGGSVFDTLNVGNYDDYQFNTTLLGNPVTFTDGGSFKVFGIESTITTTTLVTETFKISEDESPGVNTAADPNAANDVNPLVDVPPGAIVEANAIGYAKSPTSVLATGSLFAGSVGADEEGTYSFAITDSAGNPITSVDSGLTTLDGSHIMLSTDVNGAVVGSVGQTEIFKVYVDSDGFVWIGQYQPIAHNLDGSSLATHDDIASVTAALHIKATLTDFDGDSTSVVSGVALQVQFQDDGPLAVNDVDSAHGAALTATGNVITGVDIAVGFDVNATDGNADTKGTDGAKITEIAGVTTDTTPDPSLNFQVTGQYGTLVINENGNYTYTRFNGAPVVANDVFTYTLTDGDGDFSTATLNISISDRGVTVSGIGAQGGDVTVLEDDLSASRAVGESAGSSPSSPNLTQTGTFTVSTPDGLDDLTIDGHAIVTNGFFAATSFLTTTGNTFAVTGFDGTTVSYSYTLLDNEQHALVQGNNTLLESLSVIVTDVDGDTATSSVNIAIVDDVPTAAAGPGLTVVETDGITSGTNLLANDTQGADGATVTAVNIGSGFQTIAAIGATVLSNANGTYTFQADGTWSFDPNANLNNASGISADFTYRITDSDGDTSTATQAITINDGAVAATPVAVTLELDEAALFTAGATGSNPGLTSEVDSTPSLSFTAGSDNLTSFAFISTSGLVTDLNGTGGQDIFWDLASATQIKGYLDGAHTLLAVTLDLSAPASIAAGASNTVTVTATLSDNLQHILANGAQISSIGSVDVVATDTDGDITTGTVNVTVQDDVPLAANDGPSGVVEDGVSLVSGNVLTNDASGADTPKSFVAWAAITDAASVAALNSYGTLVQNGNGTWSYTLNNSLAATQALTSSSSLSYTLHYTMQDADGDTSPATLTITIQGADDSAAVVTAEATGADATVLEAGLNPDGSNAGASTETATGSFTISATDGVQDIVIGGVTFTLAEIQAFGTTNGVVNTGQGVLTLTGYTGTSFGGTVNYSYTLSATIDNDSVIATGNDAVNGTGFDDSLALTVHGIGGTTAGDNLVVHIVDDVPLAANDGPSGVVEDGVSLVSGNV
ncbi:VCBS domain-containing protein, partial [Bradyrhizobium sp. AUGA SZCCT0158]|uniref:beta strand repeat-containing protein n=1 Tax=Bradyrhizobium sp. AUGA SZCCT0158 TaxID=2807661 RepID=UPI001BAE012D